MKLRAYAKVNLGLDVVRKKENGYHDLHSIMVPIRLHDQILISPNHETSFTCVPNFRIMPEKNTLLKMVEVCRKKYGFTTKFNITLYKTIPSQAGLGGGSADAAAILNYLDAFFNWKLTMQEKIDLAVQVGADVPFCVFNRPAIVTGIGEELEFFDFIPSFHMILIQPYKGVSTQKAFEGLDIPHLKHPNILGIKERLIEQDYRGFLEVLDNSLEDKAINLVPQIGEIKQKLLELGCDGAMMTGSGSVVMGFSQDEKIIETCAQAFRGHARFIRRTQVLGPEPVFLIK